MIIIEKYIERIYSIIGRKHVYGFGFGSNTNKIVILVNPEFEIEKAIKEIDKIKIEYKVI